MNEEEALKAINSLLNEAQKLADELAASSEEIEDIATTTNFWKIILSEYDVDNSMESTKPWQYGESLD